MTRIAVRDGRTAILVARRHVDLASVTGQAVVADPQGLYDNWKPDFLNVGDGTDLTGSAVAPGASWDAPVGRTAQVFAVGIHHPGKLKEFGLQLPPDVGVIVKASSSIAGPHDRLRIAGDQVFAEVELAVVVGRSTFRVPPVRPLTMSPA